MYVSHGKSENEIASLNKQLRLTAITNDRQCAQALIDSDANGIVPPDSSDETVFKIAADEKQLEMMQFLAEKLPEAASFTHHPKTNDWLLELITAGKTPFVLAYLQHASWIRTRLNGVVTEEHKPVSDYFIRAIQLAVQEQNLIIVKALLELGCLSQPDYQADVNAAIATAIQVNNAPLLALLLKYNLNTDSNFSEIEQPTEVPYLMRLVMNSERLNHPAFFLLDKYLVANEAFKDYNGDFRKKINTFAQLLRIMSTNEDPLIKYQNLQALIPTAYPPSPSSAFRKIMEALLIYNPAELNDAAEAYLDTRKDNKQRSVVQDCVIWHLFFGENPLFQCYFYLHVTEHFKKLTEKNSRHHKQNRNDFCVMLSVIRDSSEAELIERLNEIVTRFAKKPVTLLGMNFFERPRFSTFPSLLQACIKPTATEIKAAYDHFNLFIVKTVLRGETIDKIKSIIHATPDPVFTP